MQKLSDICKELKFNSDVRFGNRIHNIEIASIALQNKISTIATVNRKDFMSISGLNLLTPESEPET